MSLQYMCMNWVWICVSAVFKCRESFKSVAVANSIASVWSVRDVFAGLSLSQSFIQPAVYFLVCLTVGYLIAALGVDRCLNSV